VCVLLFPKAKKLSILSLANEVGKELRRWHVWCGWGLSLSL